LASDHINPETKTGLRPEVPPQAGLLTGYQPRMAEIMKHRHAEAARKLSGWLVIILAGGILLHYVCVMTLILCNRAEGAKIMEDLFHSWLPVVSGLASAAATYYFTKEGK
jgi:hypothetical protein